MSKNIVLIKENGSGEYRFAIVQETVGGWNPDLCLIKAVQGGSLDFHPGIDEEPFFMPETECKYVFSPGERKMFRRKMYEEAVPVRITSPLAHPDTRKDGIVRYIVKLPDGNITVTDETRLSDLF